jgi:ankyrin repeat protein
MENNSFITYDAIFNSKTDNKNKLDILNLVVDKIKLKCNNDEYKLLIKSCNDDEKLIKIINDNIYVSNSIVKSILENRKNQFDDSISDIYYKLAWFIKSKKDILPIISINNVDINYKYICGRTLLILAAEFNNLYAVKILVEKGAYMNDNYGDKCVLKYAIENENYKMVKYLIKQGAKINNETHHAPSADGRMPRMRYPSPLADEIKLITKSKINLIQNNDIIKLIIDNLKNTMSLNFLTTIIENANFEIVKYLLEHNISYVQDCVIHNSVNFYINSIILNYPFNEAFELIKLFTNKFSDININRQNSFGETPLHLSVHIRNSSITKILLEIPNIDVNIKCNNGLTPLDIACNEPNNGDNIKLLINKGASYNYNTIIKKLYNSNKNTLMCLLENDIIKPSEILLKDLNIY